MTCTYMYLSGVTRRRQVGEGHKLFPEKVKSKKKKGNGGIKVQGDLFKMIGNYWDYVYLYKNCIKRGVWGSSPRTFLQNWVQN